MEQKQAVIFKLDNGLYGLNIMDVQEIIRIVEITPVAESDFATEGIINLRGQVIPVISLCRKLNLNVKEKDNNTRIIVTEYNGRKKGLIVDQVLEVGNYTEEESSTSNQSGISFNFIKEIIKKDHALWLLLDLPALY